MPTYLTVDQLKAALADAGGVGSRTAANLSDERLTEHVEDAEAEVLGRLAAAGLVVTADPPTEAPALFRTILVGIAGYTATLEWFGNQELTDRDPVVLRYQRALALLGQLAAGRLVLDGITDESAGAATGEPAIYQQGPAVNLTDEAPPPSYFNGGAFGPYPTGRW